MAYKNTLPDLGSLVGKIQPLRRQKMPGSRTRQAGPPASGVNFKATPFMQ
jgi:hypothetical protein